MGKKNSVRFYMTYSIELQKKMRMLDKLIFKNICVMAISRNSNRFLMGIERSPSHKKIKKVYESIPVQP